MPNVFPTLASGACYLLSPESLQPLAKYPVQMSGAWVTRVIRFVNDTEQTWVVRPKLTSMALQFKAVHGYDLGRILKFFNARTGKYLDIALLNTFTIVVGLTTYSYCVFDQDSIDTVEEPDSPNYFSFVIRIKQVRPN